MSDGLLFGTNAGCVVVRLSGSGCGPGQCGAVEAAAIPHWYTHPKPAHWTRLYLCKSHAAGRSDAEPLTAEDRRIIAERHERSREQLRKAGR